MYVLGRNLSSPCLFCTPKEWTIQSPWPDAEVVVDDEVMKVSSLGTFHVYLTGGKVHQIRRRDDFPKNPEEKGHELGGGNSNILLFSP